MKRAIATSEHCSLVDFSNRDLAREVCRYACKYRKEWLQILGFAITRNAAKLYPNFALAAIITFATHYTAGDSLNSLYWTVGLSIGAVAVSHIFHIIANLRGYTTISLIEHDVRMHALQALHEVDMSWHRHQSAGTKVKKVEKGVSGIGHILKEFIDTIPAIAVSFVGIIAIIGQVQWEIGALLGVVIVLYFALFRWLAQGYGAAQEKVNYREIELSGSVFESISNIRAIKALHLGEGARDVVRKKTDDLHEVFVERVAIFQRRHLLTMGTWFFRIGMLTVIALGVMSGHYEVGFLVLFNNYFGTMIHNATQLSNSIEEFIIAREDIFCMQDVLHRVRKERESHGTKTFPSRWKEFRVEHLSFSYEGKEVLKDVSFTVRRGEKVGIVGLSSAGKSTLMRLLMNEYRRYQGDILVDGVSLREIDRASYHRRTAAILQDPELFDLTLGENILFGLNGKRVSSAVLQRALKVSGVSTFLHKYSRGLDMMIGEHGSKLSAGERQLVGIARALVRQSDILFLEKATSSLDFETRLQEEGFFKDLFDGMTAIVVTNRLPMMKEMDRIIVLDNGKIIEEGSFSALTRKKTSAFRSLWGMQKT